MNRLTIIGNLTHDPELRTTPSGDSVCSFSVAVNRRGRRDAQGNQNEQTDFFRVSAWRQLGENCAKYLAKGRKVCSFCVDKIEYIDYKDINRLRRFTNERGKILPRRMSGNCAKHQRQLSEAIKRARAIALMPYTVE